MKLVIIFIFSRDDALGFFSFFFPNVNEKLEKMSHIYWSNVDDVQNFSQLKRKFLWPMMG